MADFLWTALIALGLVMAFEGLAYASIPTQMKEMMLALQELSPATLRVIGIVMLAVGTAIIWVVKLFGTQL